MELTRRSVCDQIGSTSICKLSGITGCPQQYDEILRIFNFNNSEIVSSSSHSINSYSYNSLVQDLSRILSLDSNTAKNDLFGSKSLKIMKEAEIIQRYTVNQVIQQFLQKSDQNSNQPRSRTSSRGSVRLNNGCSFCRTNKESYDVYSSHYLFDKHTKILSCPILRKLVCPLCGATGDNAHTLSYCPRNSSKSSSKPVSVFYHINNSPRLASGKLRTKKPNSYP